ncbi:hypothetical protein GCM10010439_02810 [Actinocorallia aurantiaca]|uniref:Uncharacterized protein n=1 Tax=Actinocorallia aurantiaca TaxID=46204 RepID=A0ABP6GBI3_9ACTN
MDNEGFDRDLAMEPRLFMPGLFFRPGMLEFRLFMPGLFFRPGMLESRMLPVRPLVFSRNFRLTSLGVLRTERRMDTFPPPNS